MGKPPPPSIEMFPLRALDTIRYADTDRQGHVNNAAFATFCETGRVAFLYDPARKLVPPGSAYVIARLLIEFHAELTWPGQVEIGSRVTSVGRSSMTFAQGLFQNRACAATAETVIVLMDEATRRSRPLPPEVVRALEAVRGDPG